MARDRMRSIYSPVQAIRIGLDNTIWIDRPTADGRRFAMVLDERGDSIGAVLMPERSKRTVIESCVLAQSYLWFRSKTTHAGM